MHRYRGACHRKPDADQLDTDADTAGDACDSDDDNDALWGWGRQFVDPTPQ